MAKKEIIKVKTEPVKTAAPAVEKVNRVQKVQDFVDANRKVIIGVSLAVIILIVGIIFIKGRMDKAAEVSKQSASVAIARILPYIQANDYQKALYGDPTKKIRNQKVIGLIEVIKEYDGTSQSEYAALYAGNCFLSLNKTKEAIDYFDKALDSRSNVIKEGASAGLGICNEIINKYKEAANYYEKAASYATTPGSKDKYLYFQGLCSEKTGDKDVAEKLYREIIYDNQSEFVGPAKSGLTRLGMIIE